MCYIKMNRRSILVSWLNGRELLEINSVFLFENEQFSGKSCNFAAETFQITTIMMKLVSSNGTVLLEREKSCAKRANNSTLHVRRMLQGVKKTSTPRLVSREEFFTKVIKAADDANV